MIRVCGGRSLCSAVRVFHAPQPFDIVSHLPVACEDADVLYAFVPSQVSLPVPLPSPPLGSPLPPLGSLLPPPAKSRPLFRRCSLNFFTPPPSSLRPPPSSLLSPFPFHISLAKALTACPVRPISRMISPPFRSGRPGIGTTARWSGLAISVSACRSCRSGECALCLSGLVGLAIAPLSGLGSLFSAWSVSQIRATDSHPHSLFLALPRSARVRAVRVRARLAVSPSLALHWCAPLSSASFCPQVARRPSCAPRSLCALPPVARCPSLCSSPPVAPLCVPRPLCASPLVAPPCSLHRPPSPCVCVPVSLVRPHDANRSPSGVTMPVS